MGEGTKKREGSRHRSSLLGACVSFLLSQPPRAPPHPLPSERAQRQQWEQGGGVPPRPRARVAGDSATPEKQSFSLPHPSHARRPFPSPLTTPSAVLVSMDARWSNWNTPSPRDPVQSSSVGGEEGKGCRFFGGHGAARRTRLSAPAIPLTFGGLGEIAKRGDGSHGWLCVGVGARGGEGGGGNAGRKVLLPKNTVADTKNGAPPSTLPMLPARAAAAAALRTTRRRLTTSSRTASNEHDGPWPNPPEPHPTGPLPDPPSTAATVGAMGAGAVGAAAIAAVGVFAVFQMAGAVARGAGRGGGGERRAKEVPP